MSAVGHPFTPVLVSHFLQFAIYLIEFSMKFETLAQSASKQRQVNRSRPFRRNSSFESLVDPVSHILNESKRVMMAPSFSLLSEYCYHSIRSVTSASDSERAYVIDFQYSSNPTKHAFERPICIGRFGTKRHKVFGPMCERCFPRRLLRSYRYWTRVCSGYGRSTGTGGNLVRSWD